MNQKFYLYTVTAAADQIQQWVNDPTHQAVWTEAGQGAEVVVWDWLDPVNGLEPMTALHTEFEKTFEGKIKAQEFPR